MKRSAIKYYIRYLIFLFPCLAKIPAESLMTKFFTSELDNTYLHQLRSHVSLGNICKENHILLNFDKAFCAWNAGKTDHQFCFFFSPINYVYYANSNYHAI